MSCRIFLVEDHEAMRSTLRDYLGAQPDMVVVGATASAEEALPELLERDLDLVLVDTSLPGMSGIELVGRLGEARAGLPCLMYSGHGQPTYVRSALEAGARGYALKGRASELPEAIREVLAGRIYLSASLRAAVDPASVDPP